MTPDPPPDRFALIDLGSNSVRLVVFDRSRPFAAPLLNEKSLVELGRNLDPTGHLALERLDAALKVFGYFKTVLEGLAITEVHILATAAVRDAANAQALLDPVRALMAADIRVLKGEEEAELAAKGVMVTCPGAQGLVADLGGGSLELARLGPEGIAPTVSLPLGVLRLQALGVEQAKSALREAFQGLTWLQDLHPRGRLYLVGGAWRALATAHMAHRDYALKVVHRYALPSTKLRRYAKKLADPQLRYLQGLGQVPSARRQHVPWAGLVAACLIKATACERVVFSQGGLREGYSARLLGRERELEQDQARRYDSAIAALIPDGGRFGAADQALFDWMDPLFAAEQDSLRHRRRQACQLFDFGWEAHPSYRKSDIPSAVVHAAALTQAHPDRAYLGLVLLLRHGGDPRDKQAHPWLRLTKLLPRPQRRHGLITGRALRLAYKISRGIVPLLQSTHLEVRGPTLRLTVTDQGLGHRRDTYAPALARLASDLHLNPEIAFGEGN